MNVNKIDIYVPALDIRECRRTKKVKKKIPKHVKEKTKAVKITDKITIMCYEDENLDRVKERYLESLKRYAPGRKW